MKQHILLIIICLLAAGCTEQTDPLPSEKFTYSNTKLSFITPENWSRTKIPSSNYLTIFTKIHYGIQPNIQLEQYIKQGNSQQALKSYIEKKKIMYTDYAILNESPFQTSSGIAGIKIKARRVNTQNIPVIHNSYVFNKNDEVFIISATCAEPSLGLFEGVFDSAMNSVEISD